MNVNIHTEETDRQGFNDEFHFENFLNYLYRSDKRQKHTKKNTEHCVAIFHIDGEIQILPYGDLDRRIKLRDVSVDLKEAYGLESNDLSNGIIYFDLVDEIGYDLRDKITYEDLVDIIKEIVSQRKDIDRCLFHVAHLDQGDYHVHSVMRT